MMTCKQAAELISQSLDADLRWWQRWRLSAHLRICSFCQRLRRQMTLLQEAGRQHQAAQPPAAHLSEEARQRLKKLLRDNGPDPGK
jgi:predicted anti-sigma-YlaC factor YlaD